MSQNSIRVMDSPVHSKIYSTYLATVPILKGQSLFLVHCPAFSLLKISFVPIFCDFFVHFFPNKLGNFGYFCQVS